MITKTINDFIICDYDEQKEVASITILDTNTIPPGICNLAKWYLRKRDIEDAVTCKWLLFVNHDEVWMPTLKENGQLDKDNPLIITAEYSDDKQLIQAVFQRDTTYVLHANSYILQEIHRFWIDILDIKKEK